MKSTVVVSTSVTENSPAKSTTFTVDWEGMTPEMYQAYAMPTIKIKRQGEWRKRGVPATETVFARDHVPGVKHVDTRTPEQRARDDLAALPPSELEKLIREQMAKIQTKKAA